MSELATTTRKPVAKKAPATKKATVKSPALTAKQRLQGIPEEAAAYAPWWLVYDGVIVSTSVFSSVLFSYVKKHETTASRYEVIKNPVFAK